MWSRKRADCRPGRFRLQAVTNRVSHYGVIVTDAKSRGEFAEMLCQNGYRLSDTKRMFTMPEQPTMSQLIA
jgi:hypothetical protein